MAPQHRFSRPRQALCAAAAGELPLRRRAAAPQLPQHQNRRLAEAWLCPHARAQHGVAPAADRRSAPSKRRAARKSVEAQALRQRTTRPRTVKATTAALRRQAAAWKRARAAANHGFWLLSPPKMQPLPVMLKCEHGWRAGRAKFVRALCYDNSVRASVALFNTYNKKMYRLCLPPVIRIGR